MNTVIVFVGVTLLASIALFLPAMLFTRWLAKKENEEIHK